MKYEVGDIVYVLDTTSLYRITSVNENNKTYLITWIGNFDRNCPQVSPTHEAVLKLYRKPTKLEKALL